MHDDDDVYDHLALERETENGGVCAKKRVSTKAVVLIATDCTQPLTVKSERRHWEVEVGGHQRQRGGQGETRAGFVLLMPAVWRELTLMMFTRVVDDYNTEKLVVIDNRYRSRVSTVCNSVISS